MRPLIKIVASNKHTFYIVPERVVMFRSTPEGKLVIHMDDGASTDITITNMSADKFATLMEQAM